MGVSKRKFTIIELLVVVAVIGILVSILLPSLRKAREISKRAVCMSNLKQQYTLFRIYADDNSNKYPQNLPTYKWPMGHFNGYEGHKPLIDNNLVADGHVLYCPSNSENWISYDNNFNPSDRTWTGYPYWVNYPLVTTGEVVTDIYSEGIILSDMMMFDSSYGGSNSNHFMAGKVSGGNIVKHDGSIKWKNFEVMNSKFNLIFDFYF